MTILVLFGGNSSEYDVSLTSASYVIQALNELKIPCLCIGMSQKNNWYLCDNHPEMIRNDLWLNDHAQPVILNCTEKKLLAKGKVLQFDAVLPICHGAFGEDGKLQGLLEFMEFKLIGCGSLCSALCMDKLLSHQLAETAGIQCAKGMLIDDTFNPAQIGYPMVIKPVHAGSSFGISVVKEEKELSQAIQHAFKYDTKVLAEQFIHGMEVGSAIMGRKQLTIGEIDCISLHGNSFFDFYEKYTLENAEILCPAPFNEKITTNIKKTALQLFNLFQCQDFARIDLFVQEDGTILFNEINTIPGMTTHSRFPSMMKQAGVSFNTMIQTILLEALHETDTALS